MLLPAAWQDSRTQIPPPTASSFVLPAHLEGGKKQGAMQYSVCCLWSSCGLLRLAC